MCCPITGVFLHLEVQEGAVAMRNKKYSADLGVTAGCVARIAEESKYCGKAREQLEAKRNKKPEIVYGDSWFGSKVSAIAEIIIN